MLFLSLIRVRQRFLRRRRELVHFGHRLVQLLLLIFGSALDTLRACHQATLRIDRDFKVRANERYGQVSTQSLTACSPFLIENSASSSAQKCAVPGKRSSRATTAFAVSKSFRLRVQLVRETASTRMLSKRISFMYRGDPLVPSATHLASFSTSDHFEAAPKVFASGSDQQGKSIRGRGGKLAGDRW